MKQTLLIAALIFCCACRPVRPVPLGETQPPRPPQPKINVDPPPEIPRLSESRPAPRPGPELEPAELQQPKRDAEEILRVLEHDLQDAFFDYDRSDPDAQSVAALRHDAGLLRAILPDFPTLGIVVEGHCDERGSAEYNLALGARRAMRAAELLYEFGWPKDQAQTISYGKEAPQGTDSNETCWHNNRRAHLIVRH